MKKLKFRKKLSELILKGEKTSTWRLFDDKNISKEDILSLIIWETGEEFAKAKITSAEEKPLGEISKSDKEGHEEFPSEKEMYETYKKYYNQEVTPKTKVKIIKFELIK